MELPETSQPGLLMMIALCVVLGILFGWMRLASGSVWPAALGHGTVNSVATIVKFSTPIDSTKAGLTGWSGWILPLAAIVLLVLTKHLPVKNQSPHARSSGETQRSTVSTG